METKRKTHLILWFLVDAAFVVAAAWLIFHPQIELPAILNPKGIIAQKELRVLIIATSIMMAVALPMFAFVIFIINKNKSQAVKTDQPVKILSSKWQILIWAIPLAVIGIISVLNWRSTHQLDPYKTIDPHINPLRVQVVSLNWKWLFIYPEEQIATVNFLEIPVGRPVEFELTSDAPMNSFWIPQLAGQMYSMAGMSTKLNIRADEAGEYEGGAAEINGKGFAGMRFKVRAVSQNDYNSWVNEVENSPQMLGEAEYNKLSQPSENNPPVFYSAVSKDLYNNIVMKFMPVQPSPASGGRIKDMH